jgi:hypothetical protein
MPMTAFICWLSNGEKSVKRGNFEALHNPEFQECEKGVGCFREMKNHERSELQQSILAQGNAELFELPVQR